MQEHAADSIGRIWWGEAVASMLVSVAGVSVVGERHPPVGVKILEFNVIFNCTSVGGVVFNVPR